MAVYFYNKKISIWFFVAAFLIGLARVFTGVHYPLDILGGAVIGIFVGWLTLVIYKKIEILRK
jgi:undecaprenyl-diphosphatase